MKKLSYTLLVLFLTVTMHAQNKAAAHQGFYLSLALGPAWGDINAERGATNIINIRGNVLGMDMQVGGSITANLLLHATVKVHTNIWPVVNSVRFQDSYSFDESFFGAGITKYNRLNFFATANAGAALYTFSRPQTGIQSTSVSTDPGFHLM